MYRSGLLSPYREFYSNDPSSFRLVDYQREKVQPSFSHGSGKVQFPVATVDVFRPTIL
jgi:hypothetical protein